MNIAKTMKCEAANSASFRGFWVSALGLELGFKAYMGLELRYKALGHFRGR